MFWGVAKFFFGELNFGFFAGVFVFLGRNFFWGIWGIWVCGGFRCAWGFGFFGALVGEIWGFFGFLWGFWVEFFLGFWILGNLGDFVILSVAKNPKNLKYALNFKMKNPHFKGANSHFKFMDTSPSCESSV